MEGRIPISINDRRRRLLWLLIWLSLLLHLVFFYFFSFVELPHTHHTEFNPSELTQEEPLLIDLQEPQEEPLLIDLQEPQEEELPVLPQMTQGGQAYVPPMPQAAQDQTVDEPSADAQEALEPEATEEPAQESHQEEIAPVEDIPDLPSEPKPQKREYTQLELRELALKGFRKQRPAQTPVAQATPAPYNFRKPVLTLGNSDLTTSGNTTADQYAADMKFYYYLKSIFDSVCKDITPALKTPTSGRDMAHFVIAIEKSGRIKELNIIDVISHSGQDEQLKRLIRRCGPYKPIPNHLNKELLVLEILIEATREGGSIRMGIRNMV